MHPLLALALVLVAGIGVTRLSRFHPRNASLAAVLLATGVPYVLLGALLGPGLGVLDVPGMRLLEPLLALGIGWIGAAFGARIDWRFLRTVPRRVWGRGLALAIPVFAACVLAAWFLARNIPALAEVWRPKWPALLTLAAAATMSAAWSGPKHARRAALLDTLFGGLMAGVALALSQPGRGIVAVVVASAGLGALCTWSLRLSKDPAGIGVVVQLFGIILGGAGFAYATGRSPFFVCALTTAIVVNSATPASRLVIGKLIARWETSLYAAFLILAGALLGPLTVWLLPAGLALAAVRIATRWATVRLGGGGTRVWSPLHGLDPDFGFSTARQGATALAVAGGFDLVRGNASGAVLATVLIMILVGEAMVAATPLTASPRQAEVS